MRFTIRECLMLFFIVALAVPYFLPVGVRGRHLPSLLDYTTQDLQSWANAYISKTANFKSSIGARFGSTIDTQEGDAEIDIPLDSRTEVLAIWRTNVDTKVAAEKWSVLKSWDGEEWFEREIAKGTSVRRIYCAIRPAVEHREKNTPDGFERVRIVWLNSGFGYLESPKKDIDP